MKKRGIIPEVLFITIMAILFSLFGMFLYNKYVNSQKKISEYSEKIDPTKYSVLVLWDEYDPSLDIWRLLKGFYQKPLSSAEKEDYYLDQWILVINGVLSDKDIIKITKYKNTLYIIDNGFTNNEGFLRIISSKFFVPINAEIFYHNDKKKVYPMEVKMYEFVNQVRPIITLGNIIKEYPLKEVDTIRESNVYSFFKFKDKFYLLINDPTYRKIRILDLKGNETLCSYDLGSTVQCGKWNITAVDENYFLFSDSNKDYVKKVYYTFVLLKKGKLYYIDLGMFFLKDDSNNFYLITSNGLYDIRSSNFNFGKLILNGNKIKVIIFSQPLAFQEERTVLIPYNLLKIYKLFNIIQLS